MRARSSTCSLYSAKSHSVSLDHATETRVYSRCGDVHAKIKPFPHPPRTLPGRGLLVRLEGFVGGLDGNLSIFFAHLGQGGDLLQCRWIVDIKGLARFGRLDPFFVDPASLLEQLGTLEVLQTFLLRHDNGEPCLEICSLLDIDFCGANDVCRRTLKSSSD